MTDDVFLHTFNLESFMEYKINFPNSDFDIPNKTNGSIDIHIIIESGDVFFATLFTPLNFISLMENAGTHQVWSVNMLVVKDLFPHTIRAFVDELIIGDYLTVAFGRIGRATDVYGNDFSYETFVNLDL